jgi:hypothetical protein
MYGATGTVQSERAAMTRARGALRHGGQTSGHPSVLVLISLVLIRLQG